jgi:predicted dinucleotide-binding enzyme
MEGRSIAVIGTGNVGGALARGLAAVGHRVTVGARDPLAAGPAALAALGLRVVAPAEAAAGADATVLAVPASALVVAVPSLGLRPGAVVLDATNAVGVPVPGGFDTVGELVRSLAPQAAVVKAFNTIGAEHLGEGRIEGRSLFLPVAGDDAGRPLAVEIARSLGFDVADLGGPEAIRIVEDHARLWIHLAFRCGWGRSFGFTVARPDA